MAHFEDGCYHRKFDLGMTDRKYTNGRRSRIRFSIFFEVRGGTLVNVSQAHLLLGQGNGNCVSIQDVDALIDDLDAKRHRRWKAARPIIAPYISSTLCIHQLDAPADERAKLFKPIKVQMANLTTKYVRLRNNLGSALVSRLRDSGEAWATDEEKLALKLPSELLIVQDRYVSPAVPEGVEVVGSDEFYYKYYQHSTPYLALSESTRALLPKEEQVDLECPVCKHKAGELMKAVRRVEDFNAGMELLDFCEHGSASYMYAWVD